MNIITKSELFSVYNVLRAEARRAGDTKKVERLNRAFGILQSKDYYKDDKAQYNPCLYTCGCKDWEFHNARRRQYTGPCKHMLAEELLVMALERRAAHEVTRLVGVMVEVDYGG